MVLVCWFSLLVFVFLFWFGLDFFESDSLLDILVLLFSFSFVFQMRSFLLAYGVHVGQAIAVVNCGNNLRGDCFFLE